MEEEVDPVRTLAEAITNISESVQNIEKQGVRRKAIVILVSHQTGLCARDVWAVLDSLGDMQKDWLVDG